MVMRRRRRKRAHTTYEPSTSDVEKLLPTAEPSGSLPARMSGEEFRKLITLSEDR